MAKLYDKQPQPYPLVFFACHFRDDDERLKNNPIYSMVVVCAG